MRHILLVILIGFGIISILHLHRGLPQKLRGNMFAQYENKLWEGCQPLKGSVKDQLGDQLKRVINSFEELQIEYALFFGTIIGALRDQDINRNEVDNDMLVPDSFERSEEIRKVFFTHGLHIFKHGIYRVCNIGHTTTKFPWGHVYPWCGTYVPYTDVYSFLPYLHCDPEDVFSKENRMKINSYEMVKINDMTATIPNRTQAEECLTKRYGDWKTEHGGELWKQSVHDSNVISAMYMFIKSVLC